MTAKDFVSLADVSRTELWSLLETARQLRIEHKTGHGHDLLRGKTLAMIFQKPSLRTRVSFETGMTQLGGHAIYLGPDDIKLGERETTEDIALVLSRYADAVMARVFGHNVIDDLAQYADIPVINGLSDREHPCQVLGDLLTIWEHKRRVEGLKLAWIGDGNNVCHSWLQAGPKLGMDLSIATPEGFEPDEEILEYGHQWGPQVELTTDPQEAVQNADVVYTDVWASMGQEAMAEQKTHAFKGFRIHKQLLQHAEPDAAVMHCLPAHYDEEISHEVAHGPQSVIFDEAENRMHAQNAVMARLMT
ncbi:MAG: ornithine carbamoyltransferase [Candidatus Bipolaricaulia bacterium]